MIPVLLIGVVFPVAGFTVLAVCGCIAERRMRAEVARRVEERWAERERRDMDRLAFEAIVLEEWGVS